MFPQKASIFFTSTIFIILCSNLYKLILLNEDHDDIMPAKGDPLTDEQKETIKNWINQGAKWSPGIIINRE